MLRNLTGSLGLPYQQRATAIPDFRSLGHLCQAF